MNKFLIPGKICAFDPYNELNVDERFFTEVEIVKRIKYRPFGKSMWLVTPINGAYKSHPVPECLLYPSGMSIIRNPLDLPQFNDLDLDVISRVISGFEGDNLTLKKSELNRLQALKEKISLALKYKEV